MSPCVAVQVSSTPLGVWPVSSNTSTDHFSMVTCGNVRTDSDPLVLECFSFFGSRYLGILKIWELWTWIFNGAGWITSSVFTNPQSLPTDLSRSVLAESLRTSWTCGQGQGWMVRGVAVVGRMHVGSSAYHGPVQPDSVIWSSVCQEPGRRQSLMQRLPSSSEERPV